MLLTLDYKDKFEHILEEMDALLLETKYEEKYATFKINFKSISQNDKVNLVIVGDWSTGKSTTIKAITGGEDIKIGTDVTTDKVTRYDYKDICVVDTPGLNSQNPEHTKMTKDALLNSDRIVYCITMPSQFEPRSLDDFVKIIDFIGKDKVIILAVTKLYMESCDDVYDYMNNIFYDITDTIEEKNIEDSQYTICFFDAGMYIDGKEMENEELIEKSYFALFLQTLEAPSNKSSDMLVLDKCSRQAKLLLDFVPELIESVKQDFTDEDKRKLAEAEQERQAELRNYQSELKNKIRKGFKGINDRLITMAKDRNNENEVIRLTVNSMLEELLDGIYHELRSKEPQQPLPDTDSSYISFEQNPENKRFNLLSKINTKGKNSNAFKKIENFAQKSISKINDMAAPVTTTKVSKKFLFFKKTEEIVSDVGGEGTILWQKLTKAFPNKGANMASSIGKFSEKAGKFLKYGNKIAWALDIAVTVVGAVNENVSEKKLIENKSRFRQDVYRQLMDRQQKLLTLLDEWFNDLIRDVEGELTDLQDANSRMLRSLRKIERDVKDINNNLNSLREEKQHE